MVEKMSNKLPFLHTQILEKAYISITNNGSLLDLNDLSEETGYPPHSKILESAIQKLNDKGFLQSRILEINGSKLIQVEIPYEKRKLVKRIIRERKEECKFVPTINFEEYFDKYQNSSIYYYGTNKTKLESLNGSGIVHTWYDYLDEFTWQKIKEH